jgi:hypothetical protein
LCKTAFIDDVTVNMTSQRCTRRSLPKEQFVHEATLFCRSFTNVKLVCFVSHSNDMTSWLSNLAENVSWNVVMSVMMSLLSDVWFVLTSVCLYEDSCLIYVICVWFCIVVSNTYCVAFLFCFSSPCCQFLKIVYFWLLLRYSLTFICTNSIKVHLYDTILICK